MKGKPCGKGYIPRARKCLAGSVGKIGRGLAKASAGLDKGGIARNAAIGLVAGAAIGAGAIAAKKEVGTQIIGLLQAGPKWTQKNPPGKPWTNENGVLEFPELTGFDYLKNRAIKETGDTSIYPFSSGILGLVFKSRTDDSFVLKVPKETVGRSFAQQGAKREWNNLVAAERSGVTPKVLEYYPESGSIKMENLFDRNRPGGVPEMMTEAIDKVDPASIVEGFTRLHSTGVSHGDAGRSNLMVQQDGKLLFIDLGNIDINDPQGAKSDVGRMSRHLYDIEKSRGIKPPPSPALDAIMRFKQSEGSMKDYMMYRDDLRRIYGQADSVFRRKKAKGGPPPKRCPGGYSIPADKDCRGSKEAFEGAKAKLRAGMEKDARTSRAVGAIARRTVELRRTPEGRAALKQLREAYGKLPEADRLQMERDTVEAVRGEIRDNLKTRASEVGEVIATGSAYLKSSAGERGRKLLKQARQTFGKAASL